MNEAALGGRFMFPGTSLTVHRIGYSDAVGRPRRGLGRPRTRMGAVAVLREAVSGGGEPY